MQPQNIRQAFNTTEQLSADDSVLILQSGTVCAGVNAPLCSTLYQDQEFIVINKTAGTIPLSPYPGSADTFDGASSVNIAAGSFYWFSKLDPNKFSSIANIASTAASGNAIKIYAAKPADAALQSTAGVIASFDTPWTVAVAVTTGQSVKIDVTVSWHGSANSAGFFGIKRDAALIFTSGTLFTANNGTRTTTQSFSYVDAAPSNGAHTYEVIGGADTGNMVLDSTVGTTTIDFNGHANSQMTATVFTAS